MRRQTSLNTIKPAEGEIWGWGCGWGCSLEKASSVLLACFHDLTSKIFISLPGGGMQKIQLVGLSSKTGCKMLLCTHGASVHCGWTAERTAVRALRVVCICCHVVPGARELSSEVSHVHTNMRLCEKQLSLTDMSSRLKAFSEPCFHS